MRSIICCACFLVLFSTISAWGQQNVLVVPDSNSKIQDALDAAVTLSGDVLIEVKPGIYHETLQLGKISTGQRVTLRASAGQSVTTIDASSLYTHAFKGSGVKNFTLEGFTVRNRFDPLRTCDDAPDPYDCPSSPRGINLTNSTGITIQNCYFDTTWQAMFFTINDPDLTSEITVIHNTAIGGQGTDPSNPSYTNGQAVNMTYQKNYDWTMDPPPLPTGNHKLIVADNVFRTNGSAVRYIMQQTYCPDENTCHTEAYSNGSLVMTGNDIVTYDGYGHNIWGGHGHLIAGNRFHDSTIGAVLLGASGSVIENNLYVKNGHGLIVSSMPIVDESTFGDLLVRNNTFAYNLGAGIVYDAGDVEPPSQIPVVYNNIVAFNEASGIVAVGYPGDTFSFIPIDFQLERNDVYGNTLKGLKRDNYLFTLKDISNPKDATNNYAGAINTSLDLSVDPQFVNAKARDFSLLKTSPVVNKATTSRPVPSRDFAGTLRDATPDIGAFEYFNIPK